MSTPASNFGFLAHHDEQLVRRGMLAEKYLPEDPNTSLLKLRQFAELLAQLTATQVGCFVSAEEGQYELVRRLQDQGILTRDVAHRGRGAVRLRRTTRAIGGRDVGGEGPGDVLQNRHRARVPGGGDAARRKAL